MVNLDIDMDLLTKYAYLIQGQNVGSTQSANNSQEDEKAEGTKFYEAKGYNSKNLIEDLNLRDPKVRYAIIRAMKESQVMELLPLLDKKSLLQGMKFFTKDKLSTLLSYLPEEELAKVMMNMFSAKEMMELMPTNCVKKFLTSQKIDKQNILKYMDENMKPEELKYMYLQATGKDIGTTEKTEMVAKLGNLKPEIFNDALMQMDKKSTKGMATFVLEQQPELTQEFSSLQMSMCLDKCPKEEIIEGLDVLDEDILGKVIQNLPPELLQQVVTQIDPEVFADKLLKDMTDVLDKLS